MQKDYLQAINHPQTPNELLLALCDPRSEIYKKYYDSILYANNITKIIHELLSEFRLNFLRNEELIRNEFVLLQQQSRKQKDQEWEELEIQKTANIAALPSNINAELIAFSLHDLLDKKIELESSIMTTEKNIKELTRQISEFNNVKQEIDKSWDEKSLASIKQLVYLNKEGKEEIISAATQDKIQQMTLSTKMTEKMAKIAESYDQTNESVKKDIHTNKIASFASVATALSQMLALYKETHKTNGHDYIHDHQALLNLIKLKGNQRACSSLQCNKEEQEKIADIVEQNKNIKQKAKELLTEENNLKFKKECHHHICSVIADKQQALAKNYKTNLFPRDKRSHQDENQHEVKEQQIESDKNVKPKR